jgi:sodium transport system ATP-binding protein
VIEARSLQKRFGKSVALQNMSFLAPDGAITTVLGGNGAGKTTTFRMLVGLVRPDGGRALVDGVDVTHKRLAAVARIGLLHEDLGLYPRLTTREQIAFAGALRGLGGRRLVEAVDRAVEIIGLGPLADRRTEGFSHGERMKVALARTIVHRPQNVILDEPTRGLDVFAQRILRDVLRRLRAEGACVLLSSHAMADVAELSDHVVFLAKGEALAEGPPAEIVARARAADLEEAFITLAAQHA